MNSNIQVEDGHYQPASYLDFPRWSSYWHQLQELMEAPEGIALEIGPGPGVFQALAEKFGRDVVTLDFDRQVKPSVVGSALALPFRDGTFSAVCCFQMLEHLPYQQSLNAFREICRVSNGLVVISLPDAQRASRFAMRIPKLGERSFIIPVFGWPPRRHEFDGQHYWEINKKGYSLRRVVSDLSERCRGRLIRNYRVPMNHYHRFLVFETGRDLL
jgi:hypothetical protein